MGFLTTLLYLILGIYILRYLLKLAAPYILNYFFKRIQNKMGGFQTGAHPDFSNENKTNKKEHKKTKNEVEGEYIDFEEIK